MQCDKCGRDLNPVETESVHGMTVCEDCFMDILSPARTCDPWAVRSARITAGDSGEQLTGLQQKMLKVLAESGYADLQALSGKLEVPVGDLEREIAALRHMEKIRATIVDGKKVFRLWD